MAFIIKKIELENIKVHTHLVFEPEQNGVTAISGHNGAGKSTIIDSLAWALYGTRTKGVNNKDLIKEGVNPKVNTVRAEVTIMVGNITHKVERKILTESGTVECNVWAYQEDTDEWVHLAGPGVSHVEAFIRQLLKMDEKGFLASVLIQQKQVDQIVSATPKERGAVIEKLTGISSITDSIALANEETLGLKKASTLIQTGDVEEVQSLVKTQEGVIKETKEKYTNIALKFKEEKEDLGTNKELLEKEEEKYNKAKSIQEKIELLNLQQKMQKEQYDEALLFLGKYSKEQGSSNTTDPKEVKTKLNKVQQELNNLMVRNLELKKEFDNHTTKVEQLKSKILSANIPEGNDNFIEERVQELNAKKVEIENQIVKCRDEIDEHKSNVSRVNFSLNQVTGEDQECPVCRSKFNDPKEFISELEKERDNLLHNLTVAQGQLSQLEADLRLTELTVVDMVSVGQALVDLRETELTLVDVVDRETECSTKISNLNDELSVINTEYEQAMKVEADRVAVEDAKAKILTLDSKIESTKKELLELEAQKESIQSLSSRSLETLKTKVTELNTKVTELHSSGKELEFKLKMEKERLGDYEERLVEAERLTKQYNEIAKKMEVLSNTSKMLSEFKKERISYSVPTLEFYASDILSKFTGGDFVKVSLDSKFNTTVTTASGVVRPISQLSGGELSATAIALRLGISLLLSADSGNLLILDEVLVSMDETRARQIMETISSISNSQIIFIAHNEEINSIADKVYKVEPVETDTEE